MVMGMGFTSLLQNFWPFSSPFFLKSKQIDDLKLSNQLVNRLSIPDHTKRFVFAIPQPESQSTVYILAAQNLSEQSAIDAELLIKEVKPQLVVAQVAPSSVLTEDVHSEDQESIFTTTRYVPTSALGVLKGCFVDKVNKDRYESLAGSLVLKEIFGIGFNGHILAAKRAAKEVGSTVLLLESNYHCQQEQQPVNDELERADEGMKNKFQSLGHGGSHSSSLVPQNNVVSSVLAAPNSFVRLGLTSNDLPSQTLKSLMVSALAQLNLKPTKPGDHQPICNYEAPSFAQSVYPLLIDLHSIFTDLPLIGNALANAQKMLCNVEKGETIDNQLLSEVLLFRIAVESLRIGLNSAARCPFEKKQSPSKCEFSELPMEDKSHALFVHAVRSQTKQFKSVVAIVDASSLRGLRKHWNTPLPPEVENLIEQFFTEDEAEGDVSTDGNKDRKKKMSSKPVVAVGAGATAIVGASSLSKAVPASTFMKVVAYKIPASLKLGLVQTQKAIALAIGKILGPSKVVAPGIASSGVKSTSAMKASASAERIRSVAHSMIASAERTSFSAMRTAFYEIMRKRRVQPIRAMPLATFGCSVATCAGLLVYGDGIECAAESIPVAPTIASLGRGLQSLHQTSEAVSQVSGTKIKDTIQSLMYRLKN